jgi:hypothetical protein
VYYEAEKHFSDRLVNFQNQSKHGERLTWFREAQIVKHFSGEIPERSATLPGGEYV